jgi:ribonucleoside-diphosphate reductase alpha chain/ribonucleoside-triphosphate reductase
MTDTFETSNPQPFDSLGLFTYLRTYARRHDENDPNSTVESWKECITRIVNATNSQLNVGFSKDEKQELFDLLYNLKCSVAGRFLWQLGTRTVDNLGLMSLQNCAFTVCDEPVKPFVWVMNFLMLGAGCGYRISQEDVAKFPRIQSAVITRKDTKDADFIVPDTRQGWVKLLGKVMKSHFYSGAGFSYSCSLLRSKGAPIKSFGGLSSGPEVLCEGIAKINEILNKYAGTKITSVICLDIMNIIGKIVVSGNVRRSAQIALGDATDKEYLQAKRWDLGNVPNWRCYSNNSVICNDINEIIENDDFWQGYNGNGEPYGLINLKLSRSCGRLGETQYPDPTVQGYNPCVAGDTTIFTEFGPKKVTEILNQKLRVYVDGELYPTTCGFFSTGVQQLYKLTTKEGFTLRATANHLIMTPSGKWVTVSSLRHGDEVKLHEHTIPNYYEDDDNAYEVENVQLCILR